jgi:hypothetical protein
MEVQLQHSWPWHQMEVSGQFHVQLNEWPKLRYCARFCLEWLKQSRKKSGWPTSGPRLEPGNFRLSVRIIISPQRYVKHLIWNSHWFPCCFGLMTWGIPALPVVSATWTHREWFRCAGTSRGQHNNTIHSACTHPYQLHTSSGNRLREWDSLLFFIYTLTKAGKG